MILDLLTVVGSILFLLATSALCFSWVRLCGDLPWRGRRSVAVTMKVLALLLGAWHGGYGLLKLLALCIWMVNVWIT